VVLRRRAYADAELDDVRGRYGDVRWAAIGLVVLGTVLGWGLVTNTYGVPAWLNWQGYLLGPFGLGGREGAWAYANLGVLVALVVGFAGTLLTARGTVRRQEAQPAGGAQLAQPAGGAQPAQRAGGAQPAQRAGGAQPAQPAQPAREDRA